MPYVDLHLHSHYSDGQSSPTELIRMAAENDLAAVAICDHDNVDATDEAIAAADRAGIEILTGVELSTVFGQFQDLHLLGYGFDHHHPHLRQALREFQDFRATRNRRIMENINRLLLEEGRKPLDFATIRNRTRGALGRPHVAGELVRLGYVKDMGEAFSRYLHPCNEPKRFLPTPEAISLVLEAGGVPVLAHPYLITKSRGLLDELCQNLVPEGLEGLEAYSSSSTQEETAQLITLARRHGLIVTGGSDFHNLESGLMIGTGWGNLRVPYQCLKDLRRQLAQKKESRVH
ncbi:MAG: PHP domain-containing protein [Deltaproteobacteria bacterium]|nr:PHP domain-containing protein [Deltaproteobacteria bacterium]